jgi:hypothetical protein
MTRYLKLSDAELDGLLTLAYYPLKREKFNFSHYETFSTTILIKIASNKLQEEFGDNILELSKELKSLSIGEIVYSVMNIDMKLAKMAALKTYDENKDLFK